MAQQSESRTLDKVIVRLPDGMRDRIKAAADANNRSMNAEIVATLEAAYPAPRPLPNADLAIHVFQWYSEDWHPVDWDSWMRFRAGEAPQHIVSRMTEKNNYFVLHVFDEDRFLRNIISQNYVLKNGRYEWAGFDYLSDDEIQDYNRLMVTLAPTEEHKRRIRELRRKMEPAFTLPPNAVAKLRDMLTGLASENFLEALLDRVS